MDIGALKATIDQANRFVDLASQALAAISDQLAVAAVQANAANDSRHEAVVRGRERLAEAVREVRLVRGLLRTAGDQSTQFRRVLG